MLSTLLASQWRGIGRDMGRGIKTVDTGRERVAREGELSGWIT